jgi:hypothetical protein
MKYPTNSTAKIYYDCEGNEISLYRLIKEEPEWAKSRIQALEGLLAEALPIIEKSEINIYPKSLSVKVKRNIEY